MKLLTPTDIRTRADYERERDAFRRRIMVIKQRRRVPLGAHCTVHFENRDTMLYQVHEMLRAENSWDRDGAVDDELEAYNPLIPQPGELSATLMLEWSDQLERATRLARLVGLDRHVWIEIGEAPPVAAEFDPLGLDPRKISAVHYIKWRLGAEHRKQLAADGTVVRLRIDHPEYPVQSILSEESRRAIMDDPL